MPRYHVYGIVTGDKRLGEYEARTKEAAIDKAKQDGSVDTLVTLCHQCSDEILFPQILDFVAIEIKEG